MKIHLLAVARTLALLSAALAAGSILAPAQVRDPLVREFASPPAAARPVIWWYWGESVTTDHGITQDLESLQRVGFGGVVVYEQVFKDAPDALKSLSPEWMARLRFAAAECTRLGLTLEVNVSNGFVAGGPWITPELGMQRLVASETIVDGGGPVSIALPLPNTKLGFYRDVALLAYPTPAGGETLPEPVRTCNVAGLAAGPFFAEAPAPPVRIAPPPGGGPVLVTLDYGKAVTVRSLSFAQRPNSKALVIATQMPTSWADDFYGQNMRLNPPVGRLEASVDGHTWTRICDLPATGYQHDNWDVQTIAFPAATARHFRLNLQGWGRNFSASDDDLVIGNVELRGEARLDQWEEKAGNVVDFANPDHTPAYRGSEVIDPAQIIDLTGRLDAAGRVAWDAPPGRWTLLRLGHTPTGGKTKHGRPENMGLECDKLSATAVRVQFDHYVRRILDEVRTVPGAKLNGVNIDSNEHGSQNWTADFAAQFHQRRGYDLLRFLPAMMGRVVDSPATSHKFLFDVRRTIADLMSDAYFGTFQQLCHAEGMTSMAQAPGIATCLPSDNIQAKGRADIPMGEFWMTQTLGLIDCKEAASAAHVYGLPVVAAEAFTGSRGDAHPAMMKPFADAALALGINRFVVLAYVHQPWDDRKPGVTQDRFYVPYQRHNTWWEDAGGFWGTLTRSSHLLRQGHAAVDILYHLGNDTPLKIATHRMRPAPPGGYDYDVCGDEVLVTRTRVEDGAMVLPDGMRYRLLVLAGGDRLTLAAARHLRTLVRAGAIVLGPVKPTGSPSFSDGADGDAEVRAIADELWGAGVTTSAGERTTGAGRMIWGRTPAEVLANLGAQQDFEIAAADDATVLFAHRRSAGRDIYFVANHRARGERFIARFRVTGRRPERWDPQTGAITALAGWREVEGRTEIPMVLESHESVFVVFSEPSLTQETPAPAPSVLVADLPVIRTIDGLWAVQFTPGWGAPEKIELPKLESWTGHADAGVRAYSGAGVYTTEFEFQPAQGAGSWLLDLGRVAVLASVKLNGVDLGVAWKSPYTFEATSALRRGRNTLEVRVVNLWVNRLITDAGLPESERKAWVTWNPYKPGDPLLPSGLLGPVVLRANP